MLTLAGWVAAERITPVLVDAPVVSLCTAAELVAAMAAGSMAELLKEALAGFMVLITF